MIFSSVLYGQGISKSFDKSAFYSAIASDDIKKIDNQLALLKGSEIPEKMGYEGALLMKKSGIVSGVKKKLDLFKLGNKKLEDAISRDRGNVEFRFLRLIIQENAPKFLGYRDEIKEDSSYVTKNFKSLSPAIQKTIVDYSKKSEVLNIGE